MASETLRFDITGNASSAAKAFKDTAAGAGDAARAARDLDRALRTEIKTAEVSAAAAREGAKADKLYAEAMAVLSGEAGEAARQLRQQARAAEEAAAATDLAAGAAKGGGGAFAALQSPMGAAVVAGVALAPVLVTVGTGLAGLGVAAYGTVSPILAASQATGGLQANMATLSPVQQQMARELLALEGTASAFSGSLQPQVVKLWGDALGIAGNVLHDIQPVAKATGDALHGVLGSINASLTTGPWHDFFGFMGTTAAPDTKLLGDNLVQLINTLPPLLEELQPIATTLLQVTDGTLKFINGILLLKQVTANPGNVTVLLHALQGVAAISEPAAGIQAVAVAAVAAGPKVGTLSADLAILASTTSQSTLALQAYSDLWDLFVGRTVSDQQAVLNVTQAFESFNSTVKQSGRTSTAAQQAFLSIFTAIGSGLDALHKNKASVQQVNDLYLTTIGRLNALHGLTPAQRADVQGLTKDYLAWSNTVAGLPPNIVKAAGVIRNDFLSAMSLTHRLVPQAKTDADALAASILKTGDNSRATAGDRATLIKDLVKSGLSAQAATALVRGFQGQIDKLHGKTVPVAVTASGSGGITVAAQGLAARIFKLEHLAGGALVAGGIAGRDSVPAMLTPGELVVPTRMVASGAVDHLRGRIPGFAAGGVAGMPPFVAGQAAADIGQWAGKDVASMLSAMIAAYKATAPAGGVFAGPGGGTAAQNVALAQRVLGWSGGEFADLVRLWTRESGWNQFAYNAGSGATGIPQALPYTKMPRAAWLPSQGGSANVLAQETWGADYIRGRYGSPSAAWAHEQAFNWYGNGLDGVFRKPTVIGVGERGPERVRVDPVLPGRSAGGYGPLVIELHLDHSFAEAGLSPQMLRNVKATVKHLGGRGSGAVDRAFAS